MTSTVVRYVLLSPEPCCVVISTDGQVRSSLLSEDMRGRGLTWINRGVALPIASITARAVGEGRGRDEGAVVSDIWFDRGSSCELWEETLPLGQTGFRLTLLSV